MSVKNPAFSREEYKARVRRLQSLMVAEGLDGLLLHKRASICYITGMENCYMTAYYVALVPASGDPILMTSEFEMLNAEVGVWCDQRVTFPVTGNPIEATARLLEERGLHAKRIGLQLQDLTAATYQRLQERLPQALFAAADEMPDEVIRIKSPTEIEYLREAGRLSTLGMEATYAAARPGASDNDIAAAACEAMVRAGSEYMCIDPIVTVGERSGIPHSTFRRSVIEPGDAIFAEVGGCYCRYTAPLMRTIAMAPVSDQILRAADACTEGLNAVIDAMQPGAVAHDIAVHAKQAWSPLCEQLIWHGTYAYSVGIGFPPEWNDAAALIQEDSDLVLQPGMCFHVTTSLREPLQYGTAMSETVLVTESGPEVLTGTPREIHIV